MISWSCVPENPENAKSDKLYYDIYGLIDEQIKLLDSISPSLYKKAVINGIKEESQFVPEDSAAWSKELQIFKSADINKSILGDSYIISESSGLNARTITYSSKYPKSTLVDSILIQLAENNHLPLKFHAYLNSKNELYVSSKELEMHFVNKNGKHRLSSYTIEGSQKMISKDSTSYLIEAEIVYP